jgi:hypothetical protein
MTTGFEKTVFLLAAADLKQKDVEEFVAEVKLLDISDIWLSIKEAKISLLLSSKIAESPNRQDQRINVRHSETTVKIVQLLIIDAGLKKSKAAQILSAEIKRKNPRVEISKMDSKRGFAAWIKKLTTTIPESELLHLATLIRNEYVHMTSSDWKLR